MESKKKKILFSQRVETHWKKTSVVQILTIPFLNNFYTVPYYFDIKQVGKKEINYLSSPAPTGLLTLNMFW